MSFYATDGKVGVPALSSEATASQRTGTVAILSDNKRAIYLGPANADITASSGANILAAFSVSGPSTATADGAVIALHTVTSGEYGWFLDADAPVT